MSPLWRDPTSLSNWLWFLWDSGQQSNALACISFLPSLFHFSFPLAVGIATPSIWALFSREQRLTVPEEVPENKPSAYDSVVVLLTYVKAIGISLLVASGVITLAFSWQQWWKLSLVVKGRLNKKQKTKNHIQEQAGYKWQLQRTLNVQL